MQKKCNEFCQEYIWPELIASVEHNLNWVKETSIIALDLFGSRMGSFNTRLNRVPVIG